MLEINLRRRRPFVALALLLFLSIATEGQDAPGTAIGADDAGKTPAAQSLAEAHKQGFLERLRKAYEDDWKGTAATAPAPAQRGPASPLDSPPFPNSDWGYGGSPDIGAPDTNTYPLMEAINGATSRIKVYGWVEPGFNFSTSGHSNAPGGYDVFPNTLQLDQAVVYIERLPDTVQTSHFDFGFHITQFYGTDYRFTFAKGYFSQQILKFNRQYGYDPVLEYFDFYFPQVGQGLNLRLGRFLSVPGIEAQLAPNNYTFSHSLLYIFDPFTDTGLMGTLKLDDQWMVQLGITDGHDVAPWVSDAKPSVTACVDYTTKSVNNNIYLCANGINDGKYGYDNVQHYDITWYHKVNKTMHLASEAYYLFQRGVPSVTGPITPEVGTFGAVCFDSQPRCTAPAYAIINYIEKETSTKSYLSFRSDFLDDPKGQRTGYATKYSENTFSYGRYIGSTILFRPELRFERSYDVAAYNLGTHHNQLSFAMDVIYKF